MARDGCGEHAIDPRLLQITECPRCRFALQIDHGQLCCTTGHRYSVVDGVPVFLLAEKEQTIGVAKNSYDAAEGDRRDQLYVETLGLSEREKAGIKQRYEENRDDDGIDPAIAYLIGATCGLGYVRLIGKVTAYPIPRIPIGPGGGRLFLDVGCNLGAVVDRSGAQGLVRRRHRSVAGRHHGRAAGL